jgi:dTDP-4-dehydrorhamnose reductase
MKILISGGMGQLGKDCSLVLGQQHELHSFSSGRLDITDNTMVEAVVDELEPELIINCAAYTAVDQCEKDLDRCMAVNGAGPANLARAANQCGARLFHISTDYVFDGRRAVPQPYLEHDPVAPVSAYGRSKLAGEEAVREFCSEHLIIRTAWLYGIAGNNFLKTMLRLAVTDPQRTIRVVDDQIGSATWTYRLAQQISKLIDSDIRGIIHATAQGQGSWFETARCFLDAMKLEQYALEPCSTADYPTPAVRPANSILENSTLKKADCDLMRPWQEDIEEFAQQFRERLLAEAKA